MTDEVKKTRAAKAVVYLSLSKAFEKKVDEAVASINARAPRLKLTRTEALQARSARVETGLLQQSLDELLLHDILGDLAPKPELTRGGWSDSAEKAKVPEA